MHLNRINNLISVNDNCKIPQNCSNFINSGNIFFQEDLICNNKRYFFIVPDSRFFSILFSIGYLIADYDNLIKKNSPKELILDSISKDNFSKIKGRNFAVLENNKILKIGYAHELKKFDGENFLVLSSKDNKQKEFFNKEILRKKNQKIFYYDKPIGENINTTDSINSHNRNLLSICLDNDSILDKDFLKNERTSKIMFLGNLNKFNNFIKSGHRYKNHQNIFKFSDIIKLKNNNKNFFNSIFFSQRTNEIASEPEFIVYTDATSFVDNEFLEDFNNKAKIVFLSPNNRNYFEAIDKINNMIVENKLIKNIDLNKFRFQYPFIALEEL